MAEYDIALPVVAGEYSALALRAIRAIRCARSSRLSPHLVSAVQDVGQLPVVAKFTVVVERFAELIGDLFSSETSDVLDDRASECKCTPGVARDGEVGTSGKTMADFAVDVVLRLMLSDCGENEILRIAGHRRAGRVLSERFTSANVSTLCCSMGGLLLDPVSHVQTV